MNVCILVFLTKLEVSAEPSVGGGVVESENWKKTNHLNATLPVSILKWETNFPMCALDSYAFCWEVSYTIAPQPADCVERANCVQVEEGWASMFWWTQGRIAQVKDWAPEFIYFCSVCCCCCCVGVLAVLGQLIGRTGCWFAFFGTAWIFFQLDPQVEHTHEFARSSETSQRIWVLAEAYKARGFGRTSFWCLYVDSFFDK